MASATAADQFHQCDQLTPHCGNCRKARRLCTGYQRKVGYVFSSDVRLSSSSPEDAADEETTVAHQGRWRKSAAEPQQVAAYRTAKQLPMWMTTLLGIPAQVSVGPALREQFHSHALNHYLPDVVRRVNRSNPIAMKNWLLQLHGVEIKSSALEAAVTAFCAAQVGRTNDDADLVQRSRQIYVKGLELLQKDLVGAKTRLLDETLAASVALSLYELMMPREDGGTNGFVSHLDGAMTLLKLRGPAAVATPLGQCIFQELRVQAVSVAPHGPVVATC